MDRAGKSPSLSDKLTVAIGFAVLLWGFSALTADRLWEIVFAFGRFNATTTSSISGNDLFSALLGVVVAICGAILGLTLFAVAGLNFIGYHYGLSLLLGFWLGWQRATNNPRASLRWIFEPLTWPFIAFWQLFTLGGLKSKLFNLSVVLIATAVAVAAWAFIRHASDPAGSHLSLAFDRPANMTAAWAGFQTPRIQLYAQAVSVTSAQMGVAVRARNRLRRPVRILLGDQASISAEPGLLVGRESLRSTTRDGRAPRGAWITIPPGRILETTIYFPRPRHASSFWTLSLPFREAVGSLGQSHDWKGSVTFDLRQGAPGLPPSPIPGAPWTDATTVR